VSSRRRSVLGWGGGSVAAFAALTVVLTIASRHAFAANADGATVVLEGAAIRHGAIGLAGWTFAYDSFWSVDAIAYAFGVLLDGLQASLMHLVPAALAAAIVLVGGYAAGVEHRRATWVVASLTVVVALALPSHALALFFLQGPWHVGTALYCLIAFCCLRHERLGWRWGVAVLLLAAGILGDLQTLALGVAPVFVAGAVVMARRRSVAAGATLVTGAAASVGLAAAVRWVAVRLGTFAIVSGHRTATGVQMRASIGHAINWTGALLGIHHGPYGGPHVPAVVEIAHLAGAAVVLAGIVFALVRLVRTSVRTPPSSEEPSLRLEQCLLFGIVGSLVEFEVLTLSGNVLYARYLTATVIFATVLGARALAVGVAALIEHARRAPDSVASRAGVGALMLGAGAIVAAYASVVVIDAQPRSPRPPVAGLVAFLKAHRLTNGIGEYWAASIVTVESGGDVRVRPVVANHQGMIERDGHQATTDWYDGQRFQFLVYEMRPYGRITPTTIEKTYGAPTHTYRIDQYSVDVWSHSIGVSTRSVY
jgi:hypothetical protein